MAACGAAAVAGVDEPSVAKSEQKDSWPWTWERREGWEWSWWDSSTEWSWTRTWDEDKGCDYAESSASVARSCETPVGRVITPASRKLVLVLGMPKTGTTSLHEAFKSAGLNSVHWALDAGLNLQKDLHLRLWGKDSERRLVGRLIEQAVKERKEPLAYLPQVDAVAEMNGMFWEDEHQTTVQAYFPQMVHLEALVEAYPHAYFILNVRDLAAWVASVNDHNDLRKRFECADLPGLPAGVGTKDEELKAWVAAHHERVLTLLSRRNVKLLHFNIDIHGSKELSDFLGYSVKWSICNETKKKVKKRR